MRLKLVLRTLASTPWITAFKVLALGFGLAIGGFLLMRVAHDQSIDTCYPDYDRIYCIYTDVEMEGREPMHVPRSTPAFAGAVSEKMGDKIESMVMVDGGIQGPATTDIGTECDDFIGNQSGPEIFSVFGLELTSGSQSSDGSVNTLWIDEDVARELFGNTDPVGHGMTLYGCNDYVVGGVFKPLPELSTLGIKAIMCDAGRNDSGHGDMRMMTTVYIKLKKGVDPEQFGDDLDKLWKTMMPDSEQMTSAVTVSLLRDSYRKSEQVERANMIMVVMAALVIFVTIMNYVLLALSSLASRAKSIGVRKCCGSSGMDIAGMFAIETAILMAGALIVVALLYYLSVTFFHDTLHVSVTSYVAASRLWVLGGVLVLMFVGTVVAPSLVMARVPVAVVFRNFRTRRGAWKVGLLAIELASVAFAFGLTVVAMQQYAMVADGDKGFDQSRLVTVTPGKADCNALFAAVSSAPQSVSAVWSGVKPGLDHTFRSVPVTQPGGGVFDVMYDWASPDMFSFFDIPVVAGNLNGITVTPESTSFRSGEDRAPADAAISRSMAEKMGWGIADAIGRTFVISNSGIGYMQPFNVVAVYEDFNMSGFYKAPMPSFIKLTQAPNGRIFARLNTPFEENLDRFSAELAAAFPDMGVEVADYGEELRQPYQEVNSFRILAMLSAVMIVLIAAMGLLAYLRDEVARRTKEIAIRKINGASATDIVEMLTGSVAKLCVPAVAVGTVAAAAVGRRWLEQFAVTGDNTIGLLCSGAVVLIVAVCGGVVALTLRTALDNPVKSLRSE